MHRMHYYLNGTAMMNVIAGSVLLRAHAIVGDEYLRPKKYVNWLIVALHLYSIHTLTFAQKKKIHSNIFFFLKKNLF